MQWIVNLISRVFKITVYPLDWVVPVVQAKATLTYRVNVSQNVSRHCRFFSVLNNIWEAFCRKLVVVFKVDNFYFIGS